MLLMEYNYATDIEVQRKNLAKHNQCRKGFAIILTSEHIWASFENQNLIEIRRISNVAKMKYRPDLRSITTNFRTVWHFGENQFSRGTKEVRKTHTVQKKTRRRKMKLRSIASEAQHLNQPIFSRNERSSQSHSMQKGRNRKRTKRSLDERSEEPRV